MRCRPFLNDEILGVFSATDGGIDRVRRCIECGNIEEVARCPACGFAPIEDRGFPAYAPEINASSIGYDPEYYTQIDAAERRHFWFTARVDLITDALQRHGEFADDFLEIGCGTGFILEAIRKRFPRWRLVGSEIFVDGLLYARQKLPAMELLQMDARAIPFANEFGAIGAFDVLEHIKEDVAVLGECHRALRPGGLLLLTVPQHRWLWSAYDETAGHVRRYRKKELEEKLIEAGYEVTQMSSFVSLLLPLLWLQRLIAHDGNATSSAKQLQINPTLNALCARVMEAERRAIASGWSFPAGGSLLVVARKPA